MCTVMNRPDGKLINITSVLGGLGSEGFLELRSEPSRRATATLSLVLDRVQNFHGIRMGLDLRPITIDNTILIHGHREHYVCSE